MVIKANHVSVKNEQRSNVIVTEELEKEFNDFWERHKEFPFSGRNHILASFCPQVYGLYVVKLAVTLVLIGGVKRVDESGTRVRGESHLLLVGDPGMFVSNVSVTATITITTHSIFLFIFLKMSSL